MVMNLLLLIIDPYYYSFTHRIHGAGIYANIKGVYWWDPCYHIYIAYMDPMVYDLINFGYYSLN